MELEDSEEEQEDIDEDEEEDESEDEKPRGQKTAVYADYEEFAHLLEAEESTEKSKKGIKSLQ